MRKLAIPFAALFLTACNAPVGAGIVVPTGPAGGANAAPAGAGLVVPTGPAGGANAAPKLDDDAAAQAVALAITEAVLGGSPASEGKAEAPFAVLAIGDRLAGKLGSPEELKAKITGQVRGSFKVDLTKTAGSGAVSKTSAEPTTATIVSYLGAGTEPLHGLTTEMRGVTVDQAGKSLRSQIAENQGMLLYGGKNLFAQSQQAANPLLKSAVEYGFGQDAAGATKVSWQLAVDTATSGQLSLPYKLVVESQTVPQVSGDFTLTLIADKAAQQLTIALKGPYTVKAPGKDLVLKSGTVDKSKVTTLTEAKARFLAAIEAYAGKAPSGGG